MICVQSRQVRIASLCCQPLRCVRTHTAWRISVCVCVRVYVCVFASCVYACALRISVCASVSVCVCACARARARVCVCVCMCVCVPVVWMCVRAYVRSRVSKQIAAKNMQIESSREPVAEKRPPDYLALPKKCGQSKSLTSGLLLQRVLFPCELGRGFQWMWKGECNSCMERFSKVWFYYLLGWLVNQAFWYFFGWLVNQAWHPSYTWVVRYGHAHAILRVVTPR